MTPNNLDSKTEIHDEEDLQKKKGYKTLTEIEKWFGFKNPIKWTNVVSMIFFQMGFLYTFYTIKFFENMATFLWYWLICILEAAGITAGVHRLWTHRSYKAKLPLRVLLLIWYSMAGMNKISDWVRDHRVHHKYTDTDANPHNSNRGFFFSHMGWLMTKKHPEVIRRSREIDMSDILADPVVVFGDKYFTILKLIFCFVLPTVVPVYVWNETWTRSICIQVFVRYGIGLHFTWTVNSVAHIWGSKPYNASIRPTNNMLVALVTYGEGWHNYHHMFPWDYKADELGSHRLNFTTMYIDFFAKIGWAYDLKHPSQQLVMSVVKNKGDSSRHAWDAVAHPDSKIEE